MNKASIRALLAASVVVAPIALYAGFSGGQGTSTINSMPTVTVAVSGTADVAVTNTPSVTISGTPSVVSTGSAVLYATQDTGSASVVRSTGLGHVEMAIHDPILPFRSVHTESLHPVFQSDAVYGLNGGQVAYGSSLSGSVTASDSAFVTATGTTAGGFGELQSKRRLRYRPGQGVVGRFTAMFTTPVANSYQIAGYGHAEDGLYVGYVGTSFGLLRTSRGKREVRTLTVATGASSAANATVTLNGTGTTVALTAASNTFRTAYEIATATYSGWKTSLVGATVQFVADSAGAKAGAFSYSAGTTGSSASFATTQAGQATTETFTAQSTWNGDKLDGTGPSGVTLDPTKGNVYQLGIQYLGFGVQDLKIEAAPSDTNNADLVLAHSIRYPNANTQTVYGNPAFPFTMAAYSAGSTTNLAVSVASFAGFIEGEKHYTGNRFSYQNTIATVGPTNYQALFSVQNGRYYGNRTNQAVVNLVSISSAIKHTNVVTFYLIRNATLAGNPNFAAYSSTSVTTFDTAATTATWTDNAQVVWSQQVGTDGALQYFFTTGALEEVSLQPGETFTLAAKATTGTPAFVSCSLNTREDQ